MTDAQVSKIAGTIFIVGVYIAGSVSCAVESPGRHIDTLTAEVHALRVDLAASRECPTTPETTP